MVVSKLSFNVGPVYDSPEPLGVTPVVDGTLFSDLAEDFEKGQGFDPAGGYGGLVPEHLKYGPLDCYFLRGFEKVHQRSGLPYVWLLGCDCGEVGCWPLEARVIADGDLVTWADFRQPRRADRDYSDFGPFVFERKQYGLAVSELIQTLSG